MTGSSKKALIVIDVQNDYFPGFKFPMWNVENVLTNILSAIRGAKKSGIPVILVRHVAKSATSPFFVPGSEGCEIRPEILAAVPDAPVVIKSFADSFDETNLEDTLKNLGVSELLICGIMTQNCVTHTAISGTAEKYKVSILKDCCTAVSEIIHVIALNALSRKVTLCGSGEII